MTVAGQSTSAEIIGLKEFRAELKKLEDGKAWNRQLAKSQRTIGKRVAGWASGEASGMGGAFAHFAGSIKGAGGATGAKVSIAPTANAIFWGAKKHTGWYADPRYNGSTAQHPAWVGAGWEVGGAGGPYAINSAIASNLDQIINEYEEAVTDIARRAFPD